MRQRMLSFRVFPFLSDPLTHCDKLERQHMQLIAQVTQAELDEMGLNREEFRAAVIEKLDAGISAAGQDINLVDYDVDVQVTR